MQHSSSSIAFHQLQNIFPTLILPPFQNTPLSFLDTINSIIQSLPVPAEQDINATLTAMRQLMNQQQYKYQKSLINGHQDMMEFEEECSYQQGSTGIMCKKETVCTVDDENKARFVDAIWSWKDEKESQQPKQQYFYFFD